MSIRFKLFQGTESGTNLQIGIEIKILHVWMSSLFRTVVLMNNVNVSNNLFFYIYNSNTLYFFIETHFL